MLCFVSTLVLNVQFVPNMSQGKCDLGHVIVPTEYTQMSLRSRAVWREPSLSAYKIVGYCRIFQRTANTLMRQRRCAEWVFSAFHTLRLMSPNDYLNTEYSNFVSEHWSQHSLCTVYQSIPNIVPSVPPKGASAGSVDTDQTLQNAASDQGLHCLQQVQEFL